jgi:transcriptional regulator with XRE-family HTH domain
MDVHTRPIFGFGQPAFGSVAALRYNPMKGQKKTPKVPGFMRTVLASNIIRLLDQHAAKEPNVTKKQRWLAKEAGISFSSVQRICKAETGANLENLELIAAAFNLSTYQLLLPNLEVENPQVVKGATKDEELLYAKWRKAKRAPDVSSDKPVEDLKGSPKTTAKREG